MGLYLFSVHHADHGVEAVERLAPAVEGLGRRVSDACPHAAGVIVVSTCNRIEVYLDVSQPINAGVPAAVQRAIVAGLGQTPSEPIQMRARCGSDVIRHLFAVAAGLDSMVVGEREIAGQVRRALKLARAEETASFMLTETFQQALRTSRRVSQLTDLGANGRSVVSVALDLVERDWAASRTLILGTGAYAGAVVSALRDRGATEIAVFSPSGRAEAFAESHEVSVAPSDLTAALADVDAVVTCRGVGNPIVTPEVVAGIPSLDIIDLALARDVAPEVADVPGMRVLNLTEIAPRVPEASVAAIDRARALVAQGVDDLVIKLKGRQMDPAVVAIRDLVTDMVEDEIGRLPSGRPLTHEEAAHALRRLAARMMHGPTVRARQAGEQGRAASYLTALSEVHGLNVNGRPVDPETLDQGRCPVTGMDLGDLVAPRTCCVEGCQGGDCPEVG